jgi:hypothetical protein
VSAGGGPAHLSQFVTEGRDRRPAVAPSPSGPSPLPSPPIRPQRPTADVQSASAPVPACVLLGQVPAPVHPRSRQGPRGPAGLRQHPQAGPAAPAGGSRCSTRCCTPPQRATPKRGLVVCDADCALSGHEYWVSRLLGATPPLEDALAERRAGCGEANAARGGAAVDGGAGASRP